MNGFFFGQSSTSNTSSAATTLWRVNYTGSTGNVAGSTTFTTMLTLPFYVTNSFAPILIQGVANVIKPTANGTVIMQVLIDGATVTSSYTTRTLYSYISLTSGFGGTVMLQGFTSASVGWHTASLQIRSDTSHWGLDAVTQTNGGFCNFCIREF